MVQSVSNKTGANCLIGTKFYTFENDNDDEATILRVIKYKESKGYFTLQNIKTGELVTIADDELRDAECKYTRLKPDGIMAFTIAKMQDDIKDIIITVHDMYDPNNSIPKCVCRQCVEDIFINKTSLYTGRVFHLGISVSQVSCPSNVNFNVFLTAESVDYMVTTAVYIEDTLEDIKKYIFPGINIKKFDTILATTKSYLERTHGPRLKGCVGSVNELLTLNNFMYDFHTSFNIVELDVDINDDTIALHDEDVLELRKLVAEDVVATYVLKYSKEFSLGTIKRKYILVSPKRGCTDNIYIVAYDIADTRTFAVGNYQDGM